jgi:ATP-dependent DNA helicase RecG
MCEQAGTGLRMMREQWKQLGHSEPKIKNDRGWKAFEFFLPGLEVDLGGTAKLIKPFITTDKQAGGESILLRVLRVVEKQPLSKKEIATLLGQKKANRYLDESISKFIKDGLIEYTIADKPNSRLQRYRISENGKNILREISDGK